MFGVDRIDHRARQRSRDVDRGIDALFGELARQDDMTVDDRARAIDDGVVDVAAIGEHGIERGDRAAGFAVDAGAFAERRNEREDRSEEHTSELQSLMRISYAVFCLKKKKKHNNKKKT